MRKTERNEIDQRFPGMMEMKDIALSVYLTITAYAAVSYSSALPTGLRQNFQSTDGGNMVDYANKAEFVSNLDLVSDEVANSLDAKVQNADTSKMIKAKREEEEILGSDGENGEEEEGGVDREKVEGVLPIRQHENVLRISDLRPQLRDFMSYNSPDLLGPDFFWSDFGDEEIELERMSYYGMLRNEFEELADFPLDHVLRLRSETLRQVHNILLLEQQFSLERGGQEKGSESMQATDDLGEMPTPAPGDTDKLTTWLDSAATDPPTASFSSALLPSPNPARLWNTIWEMIRQEFWEFKYADVGVSLSPTLVLAVTNEMYDVPEANQKMLTSVITAAIEVTKRILPKPPG